MLRSMMGKIGFTTPSAAEEVESKADVGNISKELILVRDDTHI